MVEYLSGRCTRMKNAQICVSPESRLKNVPLYDTNSTAKIQHRRTLILYRYRKICQTQHDGFFYIYFAHTTGWPLLKFILDTNLTSHSVRCCVEAKHGDLTMLSAQRHSVKKLLMTKNAVLT
jgi:hypothetical protein